MLTPLVKRQIVFFTVLSVIAFVILGWYYARLPALAGIGQYNLTVQLPASGGLYRTSNVTYRGITIGKVTDVQPTVNGARATLSIGDRYKVPIDASANVHSVSPIGEQYLDLVSEGDPGEYFSPGQTITKATVPSPIGPTLDAVDRGLSALPADKIDSLLEETTQAIGGLGPALRRLVDSTQAIVGDFQTNISDVNDIIQYSAPVIDSQVDSGDSIERWVRNLDVLAAQTNQQDATVKRVLAQAAPAADLVNDVFSDVSETLPMTLANSEVVLDLLKRHRAGLEQGLTLLPVAASGQQSVLVPYPGKVALAGNVGFNQPPPCMTGFLPPAQWRSPADLRPEPPPVDAMYCKIPQDASTHVRGVRNIPCADVPGKRAATPRECRDESPYVPLGTNPWYGDPNQILNCPAPAARCDQPVLPGQVIPAPSINNGLNPLPADQLPPPTPPVSDPLSPAGSGTVQCVGQQPNQCTYTPTVPAATYDHSNAVVTLPDGAVYSVKHGQNLGNHGWKAMLAPVG
ncbi:MCE family protein [Mycolicibacterium holsaticum]|uniref:Mammalian cell entry protein n=1 Tax=Mycolicibacterium holsaticum TaxID=152142 RepID=A0A1E3S387_9MYCO|nr:MlaD family protein [Mycolicibacterium holsaticum]ODQ96534.1 mammalian cell entry protein [Mycolicibacterium holsaticum]